MPHPFSWTLYSEQAGELPVTALRRNKIGFRLNRHEARVFASMGVCYFILTQSAVNLLQSKAQIQSHVSCLKLAVFLGISQEYHLNHDIKVEIEIIMN